MKTGKAFYCSSEYRKMISIAETHFDSPCNAATIFCSYSPALILLVFLSGFSPPNLVRVERPVPGPRVWVLPTEVEGGRARGGRAEAAGLPLRAGAKSAELEQVKKRIFLSRLWFIRLRNGF